MNPFSENPMLSLMRLIKQAQGIVKDPSKMAAFLRDQGTIDENTFAQINGMSPSQIGEYLMNNGVMSPKQANELYKDVPKLQEMM